MNVKDVNRGQGTFVDVRSTEEYTGGHVPRAINIPLHQIQERLEEFKDMPRPVIVYCRSGVRSEIATLTLKQAGVSDVINGGGMSDVMPQIQ